MPDNITVNNKTMKVRPMTVKEPYDINMVEIVASLFKKNILKNSKDVNITQSYAYFPNDAFTNNNIRSGFIAINKPMSLGTTVEASFGGASSLQPLYLATLQSSFSIYYEDELKEDFQCGDTNYKHRKDKDDAAWLKYYYCLPLSVLGIQCLGAITFDVDEDRKYANNIVQFQFTKRFVLTPIESSTVDIVDYITGIINPRVHTFCGVIKRAWTRLHDR